MEALLILPLDLVLGLFCAVVDTWQVVDVRGIDSVVRVKLLALNVALVGVLVVVLLA